MEKRKTIIYGGAFSPPTIAHERILQACIDYSKEIDADIWIMPSGDRDDKKIANNRESRINLINAMIKDINKGSKYINIFTYELDRDVVNHTIDTVKELSDMYPERVFYWVFGYDSTETMGNWDGGQWLLNNLQTIVINRPGCQINPNLKHFIELNVEPLNISSTEVRTKLKQGQPIDGLVGDEVKKYLTD